MQISSRFRRLIIQRWLGSMLQSRVELNVWIINLITFHLKRKKKIELPDFCIQRAEISSIDRKLTCLFCHIFRSSLTKFCLRYIISNKSKLFLTSWVVRHLRLRYHLILCLCIISSNVNNVFFQKTSYDLYAASPANMCSVIIFKYNLC